jgi:tetratricopeptide (TPR) repeat protein
MKTALAAALCFAVSAPALAQDRLWADPYRAGRDAVNGGRYEDGIRLLEQAVKNQPRQERSRRLDSGETIEYFPHYYLGLAYLRTGKYDRAQASFREAQVCKCLTPAFQKLLLVWDADAAKRLGTGKPSTPPPQAPPDDRAYVAQLLQIANQQLAAGNLSTARARFQEAEMRSPGAGRLGLDQIRQRQADYAKRIAAADADSRTGRLDAAVENLKQAQAADREQFVSDGHAARMQAWLQLLESKGGRKAGSPLDRARSAAAAHRYAEAASLYKSLLGTTDQAEAQAWLDGHARFVELRDRARKLAGEGQIEPARQALTEARRQNEERFKFEKLDELWSSVDAKTPSLPEEQAAPLRAAVVAYLQGDVSRARAELEPLASSAAVDPRVRAHALAYLGVAYADLSFTARGDAERADFRSKAVVQFKELLTLRPDYQLSESLVSPRVRALFDEVRGRK